MGGKAGLDRVPGPLTSCSDGPFKLVAVARANKMAGSPGGARPRRDVSDVSRHRARGTVWNPTCGSHQGQRSYVPHQQAGPMTAAGQIVTPQKTSGPAGAVHTQRSNTCSRRVAGKSRYATKLWTAPRSVSSRVLALRALVLPVPLSTPRTGRGNSPATLDPVCFDIVTKWPRALHRRASGEIHERRGEFIQRYAENEVPGRSRICVRSGEIAHASPLVLMPSRFDLPFEVGEKLRPGACSAAAAGAPNSSVICHRPVEFDAARAAIWAAQDGVERHRVVCSSLGGSSLNEVA
jgi:hypothetical protein